MRKQILTAGVAAVTALVMGTAVVAAPPHFEGFEDPGWVAGQAGNWQDYLGGSIQRVVSGTNGITSASGAAHAEIYGLQYQNNVFNVPSLGALSPYTQLGGYSSSFGPGFIASLDVYLNPAWADGGGFDWSVAASNQSGGHLRDFIWHVGIVGSDLLVNASNNSDRSYNSWKLQNENGGNNYTVTAAGWYTLESVFYDDGGALSVDFNLRDDIGALLYTVTRTTTDDIATTVGGNRYGWLVYNNIEGLAVDNTSLTAIPEPATLGLLALGAMTLLRRRRV